MLVQLLQTLMGQILVHGDVLFWISVVDYVQLLLFLESRWDFKMLDFDMADHVTTLFGIIGATRPGASERLYVQVDSFVFFQIFVLNKSFATSIKLANKLFRPSSFV